MPAASATALPPQTRERDLGPDPRSVTTSRHAGRRSVLGALGPLLERPQVRLDPRLERVPAETDEDVVQRSIGSNVAAWTTRVPPAIGSRRQHHSLSKPEPVTRSRKIDSGRASRLSTCACSRSSPSRVRAVRVVAAAGHEGAAGPSRSSGNSIADAAGSWSDAHTTRGDAWTNTRRSTSRSAAQVVAGTAVADLGVRTDGHRLRRRSGARPSSSRGRRRSIRGARWPGRRASRNAPRSTVVARRDRRLTSSAASCSVSTRMLVRHAPRVERVDVDVRGQDRDELLPAAGQDVDDATRHVRGREHLAERDGRQGARLGGRAARRRCPTTSGGARRRHEPEQGRRLRARRRRRRRSAPGS